MYLFKNQIFALASVALLGAGCAKTVQPTKPTESYIQKEFKPETSTIAIPVDIEIEQLTRLVNKNVAGLLYEDNDLNNNNGDNLMLKVSKHSDIKITAQGEVITYRVPLKIWLKGGFKTESFGMSISHYEETEFAIALVFSTKVALNQNYGINTSTSITDHEWIQKPTLKWGPFEIPVNSVVDILIKTQGEKVGPMIDQQAKAAVNLKKYVNDAWVSLQKPILVSPEYKTYLKITPSELFMTPLNANNGKFNATIGIKATTEALISDVAPDASNTALPNLKLMKSTANQFDIVLAADLPYSQAKELAKPNLLNKTFTFSDGKKNVTVVGFDMYGSDNKVIVKVDMIGSLKGTIYLSGVPKYDAATQSIYFDEMDYEMSTKNALAKSANWLAHDKFVKIMQPYFKYSIADQLKDSKQMIQKSLTNNKIAQGIVLNGKLADLQPREIILTNSSLKAIVDIKGNINVKVEGLD